jgi:cobalt/nickel transport protein
MKKFWLVTLVMCLFIAAVLSLFASPEPDGLERVAEDHGFLELGEGQGIFESPMPDYAVPWVEDDALAGSLAGISGTFLVLGVVLLVGNSLK